jgi:hypothetical protein
MYLNFYQKKIGLKAQTPTNESTKQEIFFANPWFFFHSLPQLYSDLSFLAKFLLEYVERTPYYRYGIKDLTKCPDSDARAHNAGNFL